MDKRLLTILRCPVTQKGLSVLKKDELARVNAAIGRGEVVNLEGSTLDSDLAEALVTDDGKRLYPVNDGIPVLLEDESIDMEQIAWKIQANQLSSHLLKSLAPCYLVTGDEILLVDEALDAIRGAARKRGFTSRELHVATTGFDWNALLASTGNLSLFAERRIVELRLPTGKPGKAGGAAIVNLAEQSGSDLLFIVTGPKLDQSSSASKWAKTIDQKGVSLPIWPIGVRELPGWIANRMRAVGLRPDRAAVSLIADRVEGNLLAAQQEIEKLRLLLGEGELTVKAVSEAVANSSRYDVYKLTDAALAGDARRSVKILGGLRAEGVEPVIVMWALTRELRTLATLDDAIRQGGDLGAAMKQAKVWHSRQGLVRSCVSRHQHGDFHRLLKATGRADAAAKGQRAGNPWQLATDVVVGLSL